ncbi:MAG: carboxypeptidase-like regulatory domain-containing protein [Bacteroidales bacterium]|nr:carboxypeptidase-like regulatory domain-containing protein [Bacteroidales bacterium]
MYIKKLLLSFIFLTIIFFANNNYSTAFSGDLNLQKEKGIIYGKVTDTEGIGLEYASVFIANTTFGTITNELGEYSLPNIPYGSHLLVVSYVGYQFKKTQIQLNKAKLSQNIQLMNLDVELNEIQVSAEKSKNKWKQNLKKFQENFIGTSNNAQQCKILNPQELRFHYDKNEKVLTAESTDMLTIENNALGYKIQYVLENFELHKDGSFKYSGSASFIPQVASNPEEEKSWMSNRKKAYYGSIKHFLRSLYKNSLTEEGYFVISTASMVPFKNYDELQKKLDPYKEPVGTAINILLGNYYYERNLHFRNYLYVVYTKEEEEYYFVGTANPEYKFIPFQQSWVQMRKTQSEFNVLGYFNKPYEIMVYGNWASEKLAESLPQDYFPGN